MRRYVVWQVKMLSSWHRMRLQVYGWGVHEYGIVTELCPDSVAEGLRLTCMQFLDFEYQHFALFIPYLTFYLHLGLYGNVSIFAT